MAEDRIDKLAERFRTHATGRKSTRKRTPTSLYLDGEVVSRYFCLPHPGIKPFLPLTISETADTVYADLQPIRDGESLVPEDRLVW